MADRHPGTTHLLDLLDYRHLPEHLQAVSKPCHDLGHSMADRLKDGPELSAGLRKLREAKDCFVSEAAIEYRDRVRVQNKRELEQAVLDSLRPPRRDA